MLYRKVFLCVLESVWVREQEIVEEPGERESRWKNERGEEGKDEDKDEIETEKIES